MKRSLLLACLLLCSPAFAASPKPLWVNAVGCSLFDSKGQLLKKYLGWVCAFFPNGKMLLGDGFTLTFYDKDMNVVWSKDVHTHHMITYSEADKTALVIASNILEDKLRIDRLEVYDSEGKLLKGFNFTPAHSLGAYPQTFDIFSFPKVKQFLTLVESFYRIGKSSSKLPFLAEGNYVVREASGRIYFFDRGLTKILHTINTREWGLDDLRDLQVTSRGSLLVYNSGNKVNGVPFTTLDELDPKSGKVLWSYRADPPTAFYGNYEGNVQILPNHHLLFSVVMDEYRGNDRKSVPESEREPWMDVQGMHRSTEIDRKGKVVWKMSNDGSGLSGMPNVVKRLNLAQYLQHKGSY
ncbi:MAG TPA: hypothetical protein VIH99_05690 [Bdellovibrionota bacterium]